MKKLMLAGLALAVISGCATTSQEIPIHTYPVVELQQTGQFEPGKAIQAIVAGFVDKSGWGDDSIAEALEGQVSNIIASAGANRVDLDRGMRGKLSDEFKLIEISGKSDYRPPVAADIAFSGEIVSTIYSAVPKTYTRYNVKKGKFEEVSVCEHTMEVQGDVSMYSVNPLRKKNSYVFKGKAENETNQEDELCPEASKSVQKNLALEAMSAGVEDMQHELKTGIGSGGFVVMARKHPESGVLYYRLSVLPSSGAKPGVGVEFMGTQEVMGQVEETLLGAGEVVCTTRSRDHAWATITDGSQPELFIGTPVRLVFNGSSGLSFGGIVLGDLMKSKCQ